MGRRWGFFLVAAIMAATAAELAVADSSEDLMVKTVKGKKLCIRGWECSRWSAYCCNNTISDYFEYYQFENLFSKRNSPVAHAVGFWDYRSFIIAAAVYPPLGFGTTGGKLMGQKEVASFLGHAGSKTSYHYELDRNLWDDSLED
ncbi:Choline transporter-like protein 2 [Dionaea muscipula]